ncbi:hypothetical protein NESM_000719000 [Novymonas esmeraldas]|uniref:Uncharacterized protein n=1 Tax=Novymonas esmeraldas TaxID=1808958 RepID=A0AAW0EX50_9TRYP
MLTRSSLWRASRRSRHAWMVLMMDECATMAPSHITALVHRTLNHDTCGAPSLPTATAAAAPDDDDGVRHPAAALRSLPPSTTPLHTTAAAPPSSFADAAVSPERAHAWVAVARLLCDGGDWARAAAVIEGLPSASQPAVRHKAVRDQWPLPASVLAAWRHGSPAAPHTSAPPSPPPPPPPRSAASAASTHALPPSPPSRSASVSVDNVASRRTDELVRHAFGLRHARPAESASAPPSPATAAAAAPAAQRALIAEQHAIAAELHRRGAVLELVQCVLNWQRRRLVSAADSTSPTSAALSVWGTVRAALFPSAPDGDVPVQVVLDAAFEPRHATQRATRPPAYTRAHVHTIHHVASLHPTVVARCLSDRAVVDRLLRHGGGELTTELALLLLRHISELVPDAAATAPSVAGAPPPGPPQRPTPSADAEDAAAVAEVCWRAAATVLQPLHPHIHLRTKVEKEGLLRSLSAALRGTMRIAASRPPRTLASASASTSTAPAVAHAPLSDTTRRAVKAAVESVCSPLLHHEPQVRFVGLATFGSLATALGALGVPVPNALAQCLLLCMGDTAATPAPAPAAPSFTPGPPALSAAAVAAYVSSAACDRWLHALAMLSAAHQESAYRVTSAHARALLGGLQSISIPRTWPLALRAVAAFETAFAVTPDERTLPTLLLNLKQRSWQDAFSVLRHVPGGDVEGAPASVLRDLQLVALKHASWEVPLRLMAHLQRRRADGFMNYLYCLCAAARGGDAEAAFKYFLALQHGRGRHTAARAFSPFNELPVAVAAVAMLDFGRAEALASFSSRVTAMHRADGDADAGAPALTMGGLQMAQAAGVCALLALQRYGPLTTLLEEVAASTASATALRTVLRHVVVLRCLCGLDYLRAPVRLVFDVVGHRGGALEPVEDSAAAPDGAALQVFLSAVAAEQQREGTFETRQRGAAGRQHLYVPVAHQRQRKAALAVAWGRFAREEEAVLSPHIARTVATSMVEEGVGAEYLAEALL